MKARLMSFLVAERGMPNNSKGSDVLVEEE